MSEFCTQCCKDMDFEPDWEGIQTIQDSLAGLATGMLCETCGYTFVDHHGKCLGGCGIHIEIDRDELIAAAKAELAQEEQRK